jgi:hypothetical protein
MTGMASQSVWKHVQRSSVRGHLKEIRATCTRPIVFRRSYSKFCSGLNRFPLRPFTSISRSLQKRTAEFLGTALVVAVIGPGIMAEGLAGANVALALRTPSRRARSWSRLSSRSVTSTAHQSCSHRHRRTRARPNLGRSPPRTSSLSAREG